MLILVLSVFISSYVSAGIYKCKQANGTIKYSSMPCPKNAKAQKISTINHTNRKDLKPIPVVSLDKIKTASDGLKQIRLDGFGEYSLKALKKEFKAGKIMDEEINISKPRLWDHKVEIFTDAKAKSLQFYYVVNGLNYDLYDNPEKKRNENENDSSTHFNITLKDVNRHAVYLGLKKKSIDHAYKLNWEWKKEGFKCKLSAVIQAGIGPHVLIQECEYKE